MEQTPEASPIPSKPPEAWEPLIRLGRLARLPLEKFLQIQAASGIVLLLAAAFAFIWVNSPFKDSYHQLWHLPLGLRVGDFLFERPLEWYINDGLMVIFFFVVGMEIRRELHHGELSEWKRAALPAVAALGGMVAPAIIYLAIAEGPDTHSGWGVPMATDIAFAVGILALLGPRVPAALRVLLLALAVIDDLGAIIVIALFYSSQLVWSGLAVAVAALGLLLLMQRFGVRSPWAYVVPGFFTWLGIYTAGIHPTIAGVLVGLLTPVRAWLGTDGFVEGVRRQIEKLRQQVAGMPSPHELAKVLRRVDVARQEALSPAENLIEKLHPYVAFGIMPLFALANSGVELSFQGLDAQSLRVAMGVGLGLLLGKPLGVLLACTLAIRFGLGALPVGLGVRHLLVLGTVAGVGFTMALFVAQLAFVQPTYLMTAKLGIFGASTLAAVFGLALGRVLLRKPLLPGAAQTADEAESSTAL